MNKIVALVYFTLVISTMALNFNCELPIGCEVNDIHYEINYYEKTAIQIQGISYVMSEMKIFNLNIHLH